MWKNYNYLINSLVTATNFKNAFDSFWNEVVIKIESDEFILIQLKCVLENRTYRSISYVQTLSKFDKEYAFEIFKEFWDIASEEYHKSVVEEILYTYKIVSGKSVVKRPKFNLHVNVKHRNRTKFSFHGRYLNNNMDIFSWGNVKYVNEDFTKIIISKTNSKAEYHIRLFDNYSLIDYKVNNKTIFKFKDQLIDSKLENCLYNFTRTINNQEYLFKEGNLVLKSVNRITKFIQPKKTRVYFRNTNFITMDLETRTLNGVMQPVCVSIYDGKVTKSFYLLDYNNEYLMLSASIEYLMQRKYNNHRVYLHNFSYFDGVFLLIILKLLLY